MKKLLNVLLLVFITVGLSACQTEAELLLEAKKELRVGLISDRGELVNGDMTLPYKGKHDIEITWESSNEDLITNDGVVTRPTYKNGDENVILVATLTLDDESTTKVFNLTVVKNEPTDPDRLSEAVEKVAVTFTPGDDAYNVTDNLTLPTWIDVMGYGRFGKSGRINWTSSNPEIITNEGIVTRPNYGESDEIVTMTAEMWAGFESTTKKFSVVVLASETIQKD